MVRALDCMNSLCTLCIHSLSCVSGSSGGIRFPIRAVNAAFAEDFLQLPKSTIDDDKVLDLKRWIDVDRVLYKGKEAPLAEAKLVFRSTSYSVFTQTVDAGDTQFVMIPFSCQRSFAV